MLLCSFDLETTGIDVTTARIVTAACLDIDTNSGRSWEDSKVVNTWLADPGIEIPAGAAAVHGISTEYARANGQNHDSVVNELVSHIYNMWDRGAILVVYNAAYDLSLLHVLSGGTFEVRGPVFDPLVVDKHLDEYRKGSRKLTDVTKHYLGFDLENAHAADADADAAARLTEKFIQDTFLGKLPTTTPEVMNLQQQAKLEQFEGLRSWLASQGKEIDGDGLWPVQQCALSVTGKSQQQVFAW